MTRITLAAAFFLFIYSACKPSKPEQPLTAAEAKKFALDVEDAMRKRQASVLNGVFDQQEFARRVAVALGKGRANKSMLRGVAKGVNNAQLGKRILESMGRDGTYELVKVYVKDGRQHVIFRLLGTDAGMNYHDFELLKRGGAIKVADLFIYTTGENFSYTMGQLVTAAGGADMTSEKEREMAKLAEVRNLITQEKFEAAKRLMDGMPASFKNQKAFLVAQIEVAGQLGDSLYLEAISEMEAKFPDAPNMYLITLEKHFINKDYDKALAAVNSLDRLIDKDPYLDYYRALVAAQLNQPGKAIAYLEKLYAAMPNYSVGVLELMINYFDAGMKDKAKALKAEYRSNPRLNQEKLEEVLAAYPGL